MHHTGLIRPIRLDARHNRANDAHVLRQPTHDFPGHIRRVHLDGEIDRAPLEFDQGRLPSRHGKASA